MLWEELAPYRATMDKEARACHGLCVCMGRTCLLQVNMDREAMGTTLPYSPQPPSPQKMVSGYAWEEPAPYRATTDREAMGTGYTS